MPSDARELLRFRFLRELPHLASSADLALATAPVEPWPHQRRVVRRLVERFPESYLLCDEVGLGKTVEAALALRQLLLSGRARRALVLTPRAVLRQWHEELHEKAALEVARFEDGGFWDVRSRPLEPARRDDNPWNRHDVVLASSQLARGQRRRRELLEADAFDVLILDEAHHARRRGWPGPFRPNRLLELLAGTQEGVPGLAAKVRCLYLLTATPMQIHPVEVWDLLRLLGLGGRWAAGEDVFLGYFEQLRRPFAERDWNLLLDLASEAIGESTTDDPASGPPAAAEGLLRRHAAGDRDLGAAALGLAAAERRELDGWLRRATPVSHFVRRHTRPLLRRYREAGLLTAGVPERRPRNVWIELSPRQRRLYRRIEAYLAEFYQRYEAKRPGLGFVMTIFRRRLTSSFRAVAASLERRRERLVSGYAPKPGEEDGHGEGFAGWQAELEWEEEPTALPVSSAWSKDELDHLEVILGELAELGEEPKLARLESDLRRFLRRRDRVLIFTQYLDTLDQLRDALRSCWRVACYSGRGGEVWDGRSWVAEPKEPLKRAFGRGEIEVLLCTEAASEGLNLQTCGVLINYDMPWNPMRVEQRIGRIDRIGQVHPRVWIRNYFYADTVEATIYRRLADRIDWFREVVGELQPILHRVGETVESLAMTPEGGRRRSLEEGLAALGQRLEDRAAKVIEAETAVPEAVDPACSPAGEVELERLFTGSETFGSAFKAGEAGVFELDWRGERHLVTFRAGLFAERPYSLELMTWGCPIFDAMLAQAAAPPASEDPAGLGLYASQNPAPVAVFAAPRDGEIHEIRDLAALEQILDGLPATWSGEEEGLASSLFSRRRRGVLTGLRAVERARRRQERTGLRAAAAELVARAAALELLAAENPGLFDRPPDYGWGRKAIEAQGRRPGPYGRLLELCPPELEVGAKDVWVEQTRGRSTAWMAGQAVEIERRGWQVLERWDALQAAEERDRQAVTDVSAGLLERLYFALEPPSRDPQSPTPEAEPLDPFRNAIPRWSDLAGAARYLTEAMADGQDPLAAAAARPLEHEWIRPTGHWTPASDLFVVPLEDGALEPRYPAGSLAIFRLLHGPPRPGQLVLVDGVAHPETGEPALVRRWQLEKPRRRGSGLRLRLEALASGVAPIFIDDPQEEDLRALAVLTGLVEPT